MGKTWAAAWKRAALRHKARAREASVLATLATMTQWRAVDAEQRIARALAALDAGDLSNARRALEGKPDA